MKKFSLVLVAVVAMLAMVMPGHAFTTIASCSGDDSIGGCSKTFVALSNLDTVHVRVIPDFFFIGSMQTQIFEVGNLANHVEYDSDWITGRVQLDGPAYSPPYQLLAGHTYTLVVAAGPAFGSMSAVVEV